MNDMNINCFSVTFWFNILSNPNELLNSLQVLLKDEYTKFELFNKSDNLLLPIIRSINGEKKTNIVITQVNLQYNMDNVSLDNIDEFKEKVLSLYDLLNKNNIKVLHTSLFVNAELVKEDALKSITKNTINKSLQNDDLVDMSLKLGKCYEELFYKIITVFNKKQIKLPKVVDEEGRAVPIPLISWNGALVENELLDISYEINDKYSYDFTKNYNTTEFYLNKMLFVLFDNLESDINNIIDNGKF